MGRQTRSRLNKLPHDVYRVRDSEGTLLYVGCSVDAFRRVRQHKHEHQQWCAVASTVDVVQYQDLKTARYVEAVAIAHEAPLWNAKQERRAFHRGGDPLPPIMDEYAGIPVSEFWEAR